MALRHLAQALAIFLLTLSCSSRFAEAHGTCSSAFIDSQARKATFFEKLNFFLNSRLSFYSRLPKNTVVVREDLNSADKNVWENTVKYKSENGYIRFLNTEGQELAMAKVDGDDHSANFGKPFNKAFEVYSTMVKRNEWIKTTSSVELRKDIIADTGIAIVEMVHSHPDSVVAPSIWNDPLSDRMSGRFSGPDVASSLQFRAILEVLNLLGKLPTPVDLKFSIIHADSQRELRKSSYVLSKSLHYRAGDYYVPKQFWNALVKDLGSNGT